MKTYARIENNIVAELLTTAVDPSRLFNPALQWREVTTPGAQVGWVAGATGFTAPSIQPPALTPAVLPNLSQLQADLAVLNAKFAAFTAKSGV